MQHTDAQLIQRTLQGDQDAFSPLVKKYQKGVHSACVAEDRRFSHRTRNHAGRVSQGVSKTGDLEEPERVCGMAFTLS